MYIPFLFAEFFPYLKTLKSPLSLISVISFAIEKKVGGRRDDFFGLDCGHTRIVEVHPLAGRVIESTRRVVTSVQTSIVIRNGIEVIVDWLWLVLETENVGAHIKRLHREVN